MQFYDEHIHEASLELVTEMYFDVAYAPRKYQALGLRDIQVLNSGNDGSRFLVDCQFTMAPSIELPKIAQRFLQNDGLMTVRQTDVWDIKNRTGRIDVVIEQFKMIRIYCDLTLKAHPKGTITAMTWHTDCDIPLVGGALAKIIGDDIRKKSADDLAASSRVMHEFYSAVTSA